MTDVEDSTGAVWLGYVETALRRDTIQGTAISVVAFVVGSQAAATTPVGSSRVATFGFAEIVLRNDTAHGAVTLAVFVLVVIATWLSFGVILGSVDGGVVDIRDTAHREAPGTTVAGAAAAGSLLGAWTVDGTGVIPGATVMFVLAGTASS